MIGVLGQTRTEVNELLALFKPKLRSKFYPMLYDDPIPDRPLDDIIQMSGGHIGEVRRHQRYLEMRKPLMTVPYYPYALVCAHEEVAEAILARLHSRERDRFVPFMWFQKPRTDKYFADVLVSNWVGGVVADDVVFKLSKRINNKRVIKRGIEDLNRE